MSHMKPDMKSLLYEWDNGKSYTPPATGKKRRNLRFHFGVILWNSGLIETSTEAPFATMDHEPGKIFDKAYIKRPSKSYAFDKVHHEKERFRNIMSRWAHRVYSIQRSIFRTMNVD